MSSRERLRAALKERSSSLFLRLYPLSSTFLSPLSFPPILFLLQRYTAISPIPFLGVVRLLRRATRVLPFLKGGILATIPERGPTFLSPPPRCGGNPLWHRREPAFISHLPLFFISDIRIYHRDPAGTPLESRGDEIESRVIRIGGRGRIPLKKIERRPIIGPVGHLDRWRLSTPFNHRRE